MPLPAHPHRPIIAEHLLGWADHEDSLGALLSISSDDNDSGEAPWLALCEWLAEPSALGAHALFSDRDHWYLERLRAALWGKDALEAEQLTEWLFPPVDYLPPVPQETALRAIAVADCARETMGGPTDRRKPWNNPVEIHPLERLLLQRHWGRLDGRLTEAAATRLHVLLVNDRAPKDERGRLCRLRLWKVDLKQVPGGAAWHGAVVRAPAALLLTLQLPGAEGAAPDDAFERGLRKVQTVLQASLAPPGDNGAGAWAMAWSLQPVTMSHELAGGQTFTQPWGMDTVTGGSATLPYALGALHLFRNELRTEPADLFLPLREQLRAIDPRALAMSAAFAGGAPPECLHPLDWPLEAIRGMGDKLSAFVQADRLQPHGDTRTRLALVAHGQGGAFDALPREEAKTLREAVRKAASHAQAPLPAVAQSVLEFLVGQAALLQGAPASDTPVSPPLSAAQLHGLRTAEPASDWPPGGHRAVQWHLLQRYAVWAGGEHQLWGAPARLAKDFAPILLKPQARHNVAHGHGESSAGELKEREQANSLYDLLRAGSHEDRNNFRQPRVWVLTAPPAAGKSTLLAEFEMHMAWRALCQFAGSASEHFGEVPLWVPASGLVLKQRDKDGKELPPLPLRQALADWLRRNRPELGEWPDLLLAKHFKIRLMLDGVNELDCESHERQQLLGQWLDQDYPPDHRHLPPLITVRSLEQSFVFDGDRQAELVPWNKAQREHYINQRLQGHPGQLAAMHAAVTQDADNAKDDPTRMLYSSPGMLALGCTLMEQNLLPLQALDAAPGQTVNRARLLATYVWSVLRREWHKPHLPPDLLGPEELKRLPRLEQDLQGDCWAPPLEPGPLLAALRAQAWAMQPRVQMPEAQWFVQHKDRCALLATADHLSLVGSIDAGSVGGRKQVEHRWRHHLLMEWFAAYGLDPDHLPREAAAPEMTRVEDLYAQWQQARAQWLAEQDGRENDEDDDLPEKLRRFQLPQASVCALEEPIKLAAQLRGDPVVWVSRLIDVGNAPLAARLALENWEAFGEPVYPEEDCLNPWREDRTHPELNKLRQKLHERMYDGQVHISQRVEAGNLLGQLGGSPLYEICGQALILKDDYWVPIGEPGQTLDFEMGDLEGEDAERTVDGKLYRVKNLPAFRMAGFLTTNAQYRCFVQSKAYEDAAWWPGEAGEWFEGADGEDKIPWCLRQTDEDGYGLSPVTANYWHAQAYALWQQAQREKNQGSQRNQGPAPSRPAARWHLQLPSEAQWECGARWPRAVQLADDLAAQRGEQNQEGVRWRFGYTAGGKNSLEQEAEEDASGTGFADVKHWDFNLGPILGWRTSGVGVFVESDARAASWPQKMALRDLAGNVWEWCRSGLKTADRQTKLGPQVEAEAQGRELRALRGGSYDGTAALCRAGVRGGEAPDFVINFVGFRLVLAAGL